MNGAADISLISLVGFYLLLAIPIAISWYFRIGFIKNLVVAVGRMTGQLFLVGMVLVYFFQLDNNWVNAGWIILMILFATFSTIETSNMNYKRFLLPSFLAFFISTSFILFLFNGWLVGLGNIFEARYLIVIGGMLLGNSLKGDIIGISHFYKSVKKEEKHYFSHLAMGASQMEALIPFFRESMKEALKPFIASMAAMGIVFLPGMMTGQIIGGSDPVEAIKYQLAISIAIFVATTLSVSLTILFTARQSFDEFGVLRKEVFREE